MIARFARQRGGPRTRVGATVLATTVSFVLLAVLAGCGTDTAQLAAITSWSAESGGSVESGLPLPAAGSSAGGAGAAFTGQPSPTPTIDVRHPAQPPSASDCPANGLSVVVWAPDAALGLRDYQLRGFNCSGAPLTLHGYPAIHLLDKAGQRVEVRVVKGGIESSITAPAPVTIQLAPGASASTVLSWRNTTEPGAAPRSGEYLQIVPVAGARSQILALHTDLGTTGRIAVTAWQPVATG